MLTELRIEGYKSFGTPNESLSLGPLNFVVGPNASGKTNLLSALRFLQTAAARGADAALKEHGGPDALFNRSVPRAGGDDAGQRLYFEFHDQAGAFVEPRRLPGEPVQQVFSLSNWRYAVELRYSSERSGLEISRESLTADVFQQDEPQRQYSLERSPFELAVEDPVSGTRESSQRLPIDEREQDQLALSARFISIPPVLMERRLAGWRFYDLRPDVMRTAYRKEPRVEIGPRGENLSVVLDLLKEADPDAFRGMIVSLGSVIPGLAGVETVDLKGEIGFQLVEDHVTRAIDSGSASDGTVRLLGLLAIASSKVRSFGHSPNASLIAFEEPETGLHPHLAEQVVSILRSASERSQIIVTTHSPSFLDYLEPEEVILCDKIEGYTRMRRASSIAEIEKFRKNFSLGELWLQGPLGAVP